MSRPSVKLHPDYPFRAGGEAGLARRASGFLAAPAARSRGFLLLEEFVALVHRFTFLERLMQGDVLYELPVHLPGAEERRPDPESEGERLAEAERKILGWIGDDASALVDVIDDMGIKVLALDERGNPEPGCFCGAFYYEGDTGPALLVGADKTTPEAAFILAHEFAHLIADTDPYRARFCTWDEGTFRNRASTPEEARADRFARALLMPESRVRAALASLQRGAGSGTDEILTQLAAYFEVPESVVALRLADLRGAPAEVPPRGEKGRRRPGGPAGKGSARGAKLEGDAAAEPADGTGHTAEPARIALPERFVNLALAAYLRGVMQVDELALFLRTSGEGAQEMLAWARMNRPDRPFEEFEEAEDSEGPDFEGPDSAGPDSEGPDSEGPEAADTEAGGRD